MHRLAQESLERIEQCLAYSEKDLHLISQCHSIDWFGHSVPIDSAYLSTVAGISQQLDNFELLEGILYYVKVVDGKCELAQMSVSLDPAAWMKQMKANPMYAHIFHEEEPK